MKKIVLSLIVPVFLATCNQAPTNVDNDQPSEEKDSGEAIIAQSAQPNLKMVWETDEVLLTCESVLYHDEANVLYVSNINGQPLDQDENGFISKLSIDGEVMELEWATGLDAPKGMGIYGGMLYVTNIDELVAIDLADGEIKMRYPVEGSEFLNDVAIVGHDVYFSDMNTGKLHMLQNGEIKTVHEGVEGINGLAFNGEEAHLYCLAGDGMHRFNTEDEFVMVDESLTGGDGLIILDDDSYLASRWQGEIWLVDNGMATKLLDTKDQEIQTADIGYIPAENLVLVPRFFSNKVTAYKLTY